MNIQLIFFLLFAIASAAIIFFLESSNHASLELRSTSPLTKGNIQPVLEEFGAKQIRINDNLIQFEYENTSYLLGTAILPMIRLYAC